MERTIQRYEDGAFRRTALSRLWIRPTFRLDEESLIHEPPRDISRFAAIQSTLIRDEFGGRRMRRRHGLFLRSALPVARDALATAFWDPLLRLQAAHTRVPESPAALPALSESTVRLNLRLLQQLNLEVRSKGAVLVIVDACEWLDASDRPLSSRLRESARSEGMGFMPLSTDLRASEARGVRVRWRYDAHFNEAGNRVFAEAMARWIREEAPPGTLP